MWVSGYYTGHKGVDGSLMLVFHFCFISFAGMAAKLIEFSFTKTIYCHGNQNLISVLNTLIAVYQSQRLLLNRNNIANAITVITAIR
jgi:hypothetical protein